MQAQKIMTTPYRFHRPFAALLCALLPIGTGSMIPGTANAQEVRKDSTQAEGCFATSGVPDFSKITRSYGPAVVNISIRGMRKVSADENSAGNADDSSQQGDEMQLFLRKFQQQFCGSGASMQVPVSGIGSGFIISPDGLILTNAHVLTHAGEVTVKLTDRREFRAKVLGSDRRTDVAVLRIDAKGLPVVKIGKPSCLTVGEWVLAIGSPFGFENSVSAGIVSAKGRSLPSDSSVPFIQTDTAINPGNSGGPLFNAQGEVVGINSQIYSRSGGFQGLSFAIPIDLALSVQKQIVETGHVSHGMLGLSTQELNQALAEAFKLDKPTGALVLDVQTGSPAARAGLLPGDVILKVDNTPINFSSELPVLVGNGLPGQKLALQVWRNKQPLQLVATLGDAGKVEASPETAAKPKAHALLGMQVRPLVSIERLAFGLATGLMVEATSGSPQIKGIEPGDILLAINNKPVSNVQQASAALEGLTGGVALLFQRGEERFFFPIQMSTKRP